MTTERNRNPTNSDIFKALGALDEKVDQIHAQVKRTNGRVTVLESKQAKRDTIDEYKRENPTKTPQEVKEGWTTREKQLIAFITALIGIIAAVVATGGRP